MAVPDVGKYTRRHYVLWRWIKMREIGYSKEPRFHRFVGQKGTDCREMQTFQPKKRSPTGGDDGNTAPLGASKVGKDRPLEGGPL